jgi:hypothetical protein
MKRLFSIVIFYGLTTPLSWDGLLRTMSSSDEPKISHALGAAETVVIGEPGDQSGCKLLAIAGGGDHASSSYQLIIVLT